MKQLIACCGLDCESCDARIATVKNDDELREKTAQKWSAMNNAPEITAATINCMGCRTDGMKLRIAVIIVKYANVYPEKALIHVAIVMNWIVAR